MKSAGVVKAFRNPESLRPFLAIRSEHEYDLVVRSLNDLVDAIGDSPKDPRYRLIETLSILIEAYDQEHHGLPQASAVDVICSLMQQHDLTQADLPEIGSQGGVSEILAGRRALNVRQMRALAARFNVDPGVFLSGTNNRPASA